MYAIRSYYADWRVSENANMAHSFQGLMLHLSGSVQARYSLEKYPEEIRQAHEHGYFHIHDLSFGLAGYCAGWSLRDLLLEGFNLRITSYNVCYTKLLRG